MGADGSMSEKMYSERLDALNAEPDKKNAHAMGFLGPLPL
jgi:hypothetical protein